MDEQAVGTMSPPINTPQFGDGYSENTMLLIARRALAEG